MSNGSPAASEWAERREFRQPDAGFADKILEIRTCLASRSGANRSNPAATGVAPGPAQIEDQIGEGTKPLRKIAH
jgi:hypothetical protein